MKRQLMNLLLTLLCLNIKNRLKIEILCKKASNLIRGFLFEQTELMSEKLLFVNFIIKTPYVIYGNWIVCKVVNSSLTDCTFFYIFAKTANFPFFICFFHSCHKRILQHNEKNVKISQKCYGGDFVWA